MWNLYISLVIPIFFPSTQPFPISSTIESSRPKAHNEVGMEQLNSEASQEMAYSSSKRSLILNFLT
jgi:hypothetical protein